MRITWLIPTPDLSGGIKVIGIYAAKLIERGHDVRVVFPVPPWPAPHRVRVLARRFWKALTYGGINLSHLHQLPAERLRRVSNRSSLTDGDVPDGDVVIATAWKTANWVHHLSPSKGRKFYFIQGYESMVASCPKDVDDTWRLPLRRIVISKWLHELAAERFGVDSLLIPNGVDRDQFDAQPRRVHCPRTVGFLYHPGWWKGSDAAIGVIEKVRSHMPDLRIVSFGASRPPRSFPRYVRFHLRPRQDQIRDIYAQCDVWLCTSRCEGFHLPPLEAMACRCPVVSTKVGGPLDYVEEGANGHLLEVDDIAGLSERLVSLLCTPERLAAMSEAAYQRSLGYSWDTSTDLLEAALTMGDGLRA